MKSRMKLLLFLSVIVALIASLLPHMFAGGISNRSTSAVLYIDSLRAFSDRGEVKLAVAPMLVDQKVYVPVGALRLMLGWNATMITRNERYRVSSPEKWIEYNFVSGKYLFEGLEYDIADRALAVNGFLYLSLVSLDELYNVDARFDQGKLRIDLTYIPPGPRDDQLPVANFYTDKDVYRIGERIQYLDISYSPTDQLLAGREWQGRRDVFFDSGDKIVKLQVTDRGGLQSRWFTKVIKILPDVKYNPFQYHVYEEEVGRSLPFPSEEVRRTVMRLPKLEGWETFDFARKLLISNAPERIKSFGILYSDEVSGPARLYASHVNGMTERMMLVVTASNLSATEVARVTVSKHGEIMPSANVQLNGQQATLEYMLDRSAADSVLIPPGTTALLAKLPPINPRQGTNVIYDVEPDSEEAIRYSFLAVPVSVHLRTLMADNLASLEQLSYEKHLRGTFETADKELRISGGNIYTPMALSVVDSQLDRQLEGIDATSRLLVVNKGNYGVVYDLVIEKPPAMTVMMRARGGSYKGHFMIDERVVFAPASGVIRPQDGLFVLGRTDGQTEEMHIRFSPPASSSLPFDLIFMPHGQGGGLY